MSERSSGDSSPLIGETSRISIECDTRPIFAPGIDVAQAAQHDFDAELQHPESWIQLTYATTDEKVIDDKENRKWYQANDYSGSCPTPRPLGADGQPQECDEYPYFVSDQGGDRAKPGFPTPPSLDLVNAEQNNLEGRLLNGFATVCKLKEPPRHDDARKYIVVPMIGVAAPPTSGWCRPN